MTPKVFVVLRLTGASGTCLIEDTPLRVFERLDAGILLNAADRLEHELARRSRQGRLITVRGACRERTRLSILAADRPGTPHASRSAQVPSPVAAGGEPAMQIRC